MTTPQFTVGDVAAAYGITVRTLHHYDAIGLVQPSTRTTSGYRLYTAEDLNRLAHVVRLRHLGLGLHDVATVLDGSPQAGHEVLSAHIDRLKEACEKAQQQIAETRAYQKGVTMNRPATPAELREIFGDGFDDSYAAEAEVKWGNTDKWAQSEARKAVMTTTDWQQVKENADQLTAQFAAAMTAGHSSESDVVTALVDEHLRQLNVFYDADLEFAAQLAETYVADARFAERYNDVADGLAQYIRDAIVTQFGKL